DLADAADPDISASICAAEVYRKGPEPVYRRSGRTRALPRRHSERAQRGDVYAAGNAQYGRDAGQQWRREFRRRGRRPGAWPDVYRLEGSAGDAEASACGAGTIQDAVRI